MPFAHVIDGSRKISLRDYDPDETGGINREEAQTRLAALGAELAELEDLLFYAGQHALLIILQGRDAGGKDGAARKILDFSNAQSCRVEAFKVPTEEEKSHDFLWRIHNRVPGKGSVVIFNRSHYEDVLVPRVHNWITKEQWKRRYAHINHFEDLLLDSSTILLKFYLHISLEEQEERLLDREKETEKAWKLSVADWKERGFWDAYTEAYEDAMNHCSTPQAPWYLVPADHKWFRNVAIVERLVEALRPFRQTWLDSLCATGERAMEEIQAYRAAGGGDPEGKAANGGKTNAKRS